MSLTRPTPILILLVATGPDTPRRSERTPTATTEGGAHG